MIEEAVGTQKAGPIQQLTDVNQSIVGMTKRNELGNAIFRRFSYFLSYQSTFSLLSQAVRSREMPPNPYNPAIHQDILLNSDKLKCLPYIHFSQQKNLFQKENF